MNDLKQFFAYAHLPEHLAKISKEFADLADDMDVSLPENPEKEQIFRKLLEAKDCAVRAAIYKHPYSDDIDNLGSNKFSV